jgi:hypothetical protein
LKALVIKVKEKEYLEMNSYPGIINQNVLDWNGICRHLNTAIDKFEMIHGSDFLTTLERDRLKIEGLQREFQGTLQKASLKLEDLVDKVSQR